MEPITLFVKTEVDMITAFILQPGFIIFHLVVAKFNFYRYASMFSEFPRKGKVQGYWHHFFYICREQFKNSSGSDNSYFLVHVHSD